MSLTQPRPSKEEDITAVLGRFKAWNTGLDAQRAQDTKAFTGLEEISYEEALSDHAKRRILPRTATVRQVDLSSAIKAAKDAITLSPSSQLPSAQARTGSVPGPISFAADEVTESTFASAVPGMTATTADPTHVVTGTSRYPGARISKQATLPIDKEAPTVRASSTNSKNAKRKVVSTQAESFPEKRASQSKAATTSRSLHDPLKTPLASSSRSQPTFKAVLEERIAADHKQGRTRVSAVPLARNSGAVTTKSAMVPWVESQAVSLKLRISAGEHAAIKAGASEAGLSLAAYMRQCTLDVEVLRKLLKQTIADIRTFEPSAGQPLLASPDKNDVSAKQSRRGLLKRLKDAWLDRVPEADI